MFAPFSSTRDGLAGGGGRIGTGTVWLNPVGGFFVAASVDMVLSFASSICSSVLLYFFHNQALFVSPSRFLLK